MEISRKQVDDDIRLLIDKSKQVKSFDEYKYIDDCFTSLYDMYLYLFNEEIRKDIKRNHSYEKEISKRPDVILEKYNKDISYNLELCKRLNEIFNESSFDIKTGIPEKEISKEEFMNIIDKFLLQYDKNMYNYSKIMIRNKQVGIGNFFEDDGVTYHIYVLNKQYILLNENYTVRGMVSYIHELSHAYISYILSNKPNQIYNFDYSYYEFFPFYMEKLFIKFLIDNNKYMYDTVMYENDYLDSLLSYSICFEDTIDTHRKFINKSKKEDKKNYLMYTYGIYLALIKSEDYTLDKIDTLKRVSNYINRYGLSFNNNELETLGITREEMLEGKKLKKVLENHEKRVSKI